MQLSKKIILIVVSLFFVFVAFCIFVAVEENSQTDLEVITLDIGQGDAILIKTPYKQNILIDGGPDNGVARGIDRHLPFWQRKIDLMVLTHPDADHVTGLVEVLRRYPVERVMGTGVAHTLPAYIEWLKIIKDEKIPMDIVRAPMTVEFGKDLRMDILWPISDFVAVDVEDNNETSIVAKLIYGETSFLLTGDATIKSEEQMILSARSARSRSPLATSSVARFENIDLKSDVLKVGHHGSKGSTSLEFVEMVKPEFATISVGADNRFGHPTRRVLKNLEKVGTVILRTDLLGDVVLVSDGERVYYVR